MDTTATHMNKVLTSLHWTTVAIESQTLLPSVGSSQFWCVDASASCCPRSTMLTFGRERDELFSRRQGLTGSQKGLFQLLVLLFQHCVQAEKKLLLLNASHDRWFAHSQTLGHPFHAVG